MFFYFIKFIFWLQNCLLLPVDLLLLKTYNIMMRSLYLLLFSISFSALYSQSTLTVTRSDNQKPIKGAVISCNGKILGKTNEKGITIFTTKCPKVDVEIDNYIGDEVVVDKVMELALD